MSTMERSKITFYMDLLVVSDLADSRAKIAFSFHVWVSIADCVKGFLKPALFSLGPTPHFHPYNGLNK